MTEAQKQLRSAEPLDLLAALALAKQHYSEKAINASTQGQEACDLAQKELSQIASLVRRAKAGLRAQGITGDEATRRLIALLQETYSEWGDALRSGDYSHVV